MRHAVILAGGSGTRLWPASRAARPKQFLALGDRPGESLIAATARRLTGVRIAVVTAGHQAPLVRAALPALDPAAIISEPTGRNTAAALGLAAVHLLHVDPDAVMGAIPADQHVADEAGFAAVVGEAFALAEAHDVIVTIGIVPTRPETGFGYLQVGEPFAGHARVVARFVEKPDQATAEGYLASGDYLWNGGMFFVKAARLLRDLERFMPETHRGLTEIAAALTGGDADQVAARVSPTLPAVSIDYGVMERADDVITLPGDFGWSDVGSWSALGEYRAADEHGNITEGNAVVSSGRGNIVLADADHAVCVVGLDDLVVVQDGDAILVIPKSRAQDVRDAVAALRARGLDRFL
ncbi:MAG TPA: mannose-1-phosphate guanylyltransferase [Kofleriaceae bacterium]|nr:mannose-1-phosphate guanylyltransferase [Kofleriaceae bacterium]